MDLLAPFRRRRRAKAAGGMLAPSGVGSGWSNVFSYRPRGDVFPGSWQRDVRISPDQMMKMHAVFACTSQIASDVSKMRLYLRQRSANNAYWTESQNPAYSPVLSQPNNYQNVGQFLESWLWSKLNTGNAYLLKVRDNRNVVIALYPLDPFRVLPKVSTDGQVAVFYELHPDNMSGITESIMVPAREIIHDRFNTIHHPMVGVSPLFAAGAAAAGGLSMANSTARFFQKGAKLSGVLTAPGQIDPDTAKRLEDRWEDEYAGESNSGRIAVLGSGLEFKSMQMSMIDAQIVDQMKWSATQICSIYHVPPFKIALDVWPRGTDVTSLSVDYLTSCLQTYIEAIERCLTAGLGLTGGLAVGLDESGLLRMNPPALVAMLSQAVLSAQMTPNEARARLGLPPVPGGDSCYLQQQNFSLEALAKRDASADPFAAGAAAAPSTTLMLPSGQTIDIAAEVRRHLPAEPDIGDAVARGIRPAIDTLRSETNERLKRAAEESERLQEQIDQMKGDTVTSIEEFDANGNLVSVARSTTRYPRS